MKRTWLFILPWVVSVAVNPPCPTDGQIVDFDCGVTTYTLEPARIGCTGSRENCDWLYDMRDAFNDAHEQTVESIHEQEVLDSSATQNRLDEKCKEDSPHCLGTAISTSTIP